MSKKNRKVDSKEVGLEIGLILFKYFLDTEYLHYGFFTEDLPVEVRSLAQAQIQYADFLKGNIPANVKSILDVGCGSGRFALELVNSGYEVDCVSPGTHLTEYAKKLLGNKCQIFHSKFEAVETEKRYDMVMFSESFQYIPMKDAFAQALKFLKPGGVIMVSDFFQTGAPGKSALGGGHKFSEFEEILKDVPVKVLTSRDITKETQPTIDLVNKLSMEVIKPVYNLLFLLLDDRFPLVGKLIRWKYKKKLEKMQNKHFKGERSGANFAIHKKYMFYLFQADKK